VSRASFAIAAAVAGAFVLSRAWIADDAFITYRVIDNLLAGHGLRWNVDERVQVFTHPLWALLHVPLYALSGSLPFTSLALAAVCMGLAGVLAWRAVGVRRDCFLLAFVVPLAASRAFADHAVSGLETPLAALCLALFAALALRPVRDGRSSWLGIGLAASLVATTRLDALLLVLPCLALLALRERGRLAWGRLVLGVLPLVAWELWSLLYYGFAFPNTKYAKLDTGIPVAALALQGSHYALDLLRRDPASAGLLLLALGLCLRRALSPRLRVEPAALVWIGLGLGIAASVGWVIAIGGDFMSGRFFAPAVFLAVLLVAYELRESPRSATGVAAAVVLASLASAAMRPLDPDAGWHGIADERRVFERTTSLFWRPGIRDGAPERHPWSQDGARARAHARERGRALVRVRGAGGMLGFAAGPDVIVIDDFGLGDALLARLPVQDPRRWRIGHFRRSLPAGYLHARETGDSGRMSPELRRYWEALRLVVSGPLLDPDRLLAIARFQLGSYAAPEESDADAGSSTWRDRGDRMHRGGSRGL
jgi:arabinofuranosyltransferase